MRADASGPDGAVREKADCTALCKSRSLPVDACLPFKSESFLARKMPTFSLLLADRLLCRSLSSLNEEASA